MTSSSALVPDARPGAGLERLRRRLATRDAWMFDEDIFAAAVARRSVRSSSTECWPRPTTGR